jgi:hypothetical protein
MTRLRRLIVLAGGLISATHADAQPVPGNTGATVELQLDIVKTIAVYEMAKPCEKTKVVDTKVLKIEHVPMLQTTERWTVDSCGSISSYSVILLSAPSGGTYIVVRPE